ncbi:hypothetical protein D5R81_04665 [Parashewanella spongiae]|uniref:Uncharacterized protein n=2 Tax=Parashewanella spongiae TaxID=342950 RepID=A0A3A6TW60_9GAMM|nr:hypothetical protein D5R81_04665 [Parashewanella spongiae]
MEVTNNNNPFGFDTDPEDEPDSTPPLPLDQAALKNTDETSPISKNTDENQKITTEQLEPTPVRPMRKKERERLEAQASKN